jgi:hypothetical protein|tara:strand:- start:225 stop:731 length:507 start_codon:yes stop_codon:yes gene_type:complete
LVAEKSNLCDCGSKEITNLKCGGFDCDNFICINCMVQTNTVPKCKGCANLQINPAFNPTLRDILLSITGGLTLSILYSILITFVLNFSNITGGFNFYFLLLLTPFFGLIVSLAIEKISRYKKNIKLQIIAGLCVFITHALIWSTSILTLPSLASLLIGIYISNSRVRP